MHSSCYKFVHFLTICPRLTGHSHVNQARLQLPACLPSTMNYWHILDIYVQFKQAPSWARYSRQKGCHKVKAGYTEKLKGQSKLYETLSQKNKTNKQEERMGRKWKRQVIREKNEGRRQNESIHPKLCFLVILNKQATEICPCQKVEKQTQTHSLIFKCQVKGHLTTFHYNL